MQVLPGSSLAENDVESARHVPFFSLSRKCRLQTDPQALEAYYGNRRLMWRNLLFIGIANIGWSQSVQLVTPLMAMGLLELGIRENIQATINTANYWLVSFLVMLFAWTSDHTVSRMGRRKPYLFIAAPAIILAICVFPFMAAARWVWPLLALWSIYLLFMDLKNSTFALILIDCVARQRLARACSILGICMGLVGFFSNWYAGSLLRLGEWVPYLVAGTVMMFATTMAWFIREPPIYYPRTESFKPWSTMKIAFQDKRMLVLMIGVSMTMGYASVAGAAAANPLLWFWAKETLGLSRGDIFQSVAWAALANVVLAYPVGWIIDRFGGLKVVAVYWLLMVGCFILTLTVHDKSGLILLVLSQTLVFPLQQAAEIMVYKASPPKDVGSFTSTTSFFRNLFVGTLGLSVGWIVYWSGHNYIIGFAIGLGFSTLGFCLLIIYSALMKRRPFTLVDRQAI